MIDIKNKVFASLFAGLIMVEFINNSKSFCLNLIFLICLRL